MGPKYYVATATSKFSGRGRNAASKYYCSLATHIAYQDFEGELV